MTGLEKAKSQKQAAFFPSEQQSGLLYFLFVCAAFLPTAFYRSIWTDFTDKTPAFGLLFSLSFRIPFPVSLKEEKRPFCTSERNGT